MTPNLSKPILGSFVLLFSQILFSQTTVTLTTTGAGTWAVPANVYSVQVECYGGGGGGGAGSLLTSAGGGGGGGYALKNSVCVTPNTSVNYNVGAGGSGNASGSGGNGGDTWFSSAATVKAAGGSGGQPNSGTGGGGTGGAVNIGDVVRNGGNGGNTSSGLSGGGAGGGAGGTVSNGGNGANAISGGGSAGGAGGGGLAGNGAIGGTGNGTAGANYGGGGGGARDYIGGQSGGAGAQGVIVITYTPSTITASLSYSAASYCTTEAPQSPTLTGTGSYTGGTFTATPAGLTIDAATGVITPASSTAGTYTITYSISISGCPANLATASVTINAGPTVNITASPNTAICEGDVVTLTAAGSATTYTWSDGITNGVSFTPAGTTTYTVTGTGVGCDATATYTVTVISATATASNTGPYCTDAQIALSAIGSPTATFSWSGPNGFTSSLQNPTLPASGNGGVYSVTVTDGSCPAVTTTNVVVSGSVAPTGVVATATPSSVCPGASVTLNGSANGATSWSWTGPGGFSSTLQNPSIPSVSVGQSGTYILVATNDCGSSAPSNTTVSITNISANISGNLSYCIGATGTNLTASGGTDYVWSSGETTASILAVTGCYTVTATTAGCSATASACVTEEPLPVIAVNPSPSGAVCAGTTVTLTANGATTYSWSSGQGGASINEAPTVNTTYTVTGTSNIGCSASASYVVTVNPVPTVSIVASPNTAVCSGTQVTLTGNGATSYSWSGGIANSVAFVPSVGATTYTVTGTAAGCSASASYVVTVNANPTVNTNVADMTCNNANDGRISVVVTGGTPTYVYMWSPGVSASSSAQNLQAGNYVITVIDGEGCSATTTAVITNPPLLDATFANTDAVCNGQASGIIQITATGGGAPYHYSILPAANNSDGIFNNLRAGNYTVSVVDDRLCMKTFSTTIGEPAPMTISTNPGGEVDVDLGDAIEITATSNVTGASFAWSDPNGVSCADCATTTLLTSKDATYTVEASVAGGACKVSAQVKVKVRKNYDVFVPNAFSPNEDGNNDEYEIFAHNKKSLKYLKFSVFDRWGELVYRTYDINFKWDGYYNGTKLHPGVYTYSLELLFVNGHKKNSSGTVTLIQ